MNTTNKVSTSNNHSSNNTSNNSRHPPAAHLISPNMISEVPYERDLSVRGRQRVRDHTRLNVKPLRKEESSTLRGRSRQRASSPTMGLRSRNASSSSSSLYRAQQTQLFPHSKRDFLHHTMPNTTRRQHCPSRPTSPSRPRTLRRNQRSRSRPRGAQHVSVEFDLSRANLDPHSHSHLRNEVVLSDGEHSDPEPSGHPEQ